MQTQIALLRIILYIRCGGYIKNVCSVSNAIRIFLISMELEGARSAIYELFGNIRPNLLRSISGSIPNVCTAFRTKQKNDLLSDTIINNKLGKPLSLSNSFPLFGCLHDPDMISKIAENIYLDQLTAPSITMFLM